MSLSAFERNLKVARTDVLCTTRKIVFGCDSVSKIAEEVKHLNGKNVLVITDRNLKKVGLVNRVLEPLEKARLGVTIFDEATAEPTVESVAQAVDFSSEGEFDVMIGFGGGACLDTAKTTAVMTTNPGDIRDYLACLPNPFEDKVKKKGLPLILVPTTAGTGSENTAGSVIIEGEYKTWIASAYLYPDVSIVDPLLTVTLPPRLTAGCGMDALSHAVEGFMVVALANPWGDAFALKAIELISQNLRESYHCGETLEARWNMAWAADLAGWVAQLTWGPATLGHCTAEAIGPKYHIPHGIICGVMLPYVMKFNLPAITDRLALVASAMGENVRNLSVHEAAIRAIEAVTEFMRDVDLPLSLREVNVPQADIAKLAKYIVNERQYLYDFPRLHPRKLTIENTTRFLEEAWEGKWQNGGI